MATTAAQGLGDVAGAAAEQGTEAIENVATGVKNMFGNMFGYIDTKTHFGGGKRRKTTKKRRHKRGGVKKDYLIKINELTNDVLKETGIFFKYILAVQKEITWLYLNTNNQGMDKLNKLFVKYPISIKFNNNGLVKMFTKSSSGILSKVQRDAENNNHFQVYYLPLVKLKNKLERIGIKGGKRSKIKSNRKKKTRRKNQKQRKKTRHRN